MYVLVINKNKILSFAGKISETEGYNIKQGKQDTEY